MQFRRAQIAKAFTWSPGPAAEDKVLWKFSEQDPHCLDDWVVSTDEVVDGSSHCTFKVKDNVAVFKGKVKLNPHGTTAERGYCAIRASVPRLNSDLSDYEGIGLRIRADANVYAFNVKSKSFFPDDLYQGFIRVGEPSSSRQFVDVELPFEKLLLTSYGFQKMVNRPLPQDKLTHIGITIIAEKDTPFELQIESIKALAEVDYESADDMEQKQKDLEREARLKLATARRKRILRDEAASANQE